jgi:hypothetical protein
LQRYKKFIKVLIIFELKNIAKFYKLFNYY